MEQELNLCPFCGGEGRADKELRGNLKPDDQEAYAHMIRCRSCAAQGGWAKTPGNAVRHWNMRQADRAEATLAEVRRVLPAHAVDLMLMWMEGKPAEMLRAYTAILRAAEQGGE